MKSVYYSSLIKLVVSTFLVYKGKKCLLKSGKVNHPLVTMLPTSGNVVTNGW